MTRQFKLYSDGACSGNPGPGAYGAIAIDAGGREKIFKRALSKEHFAKYKKGKKK